MVELNNICHCQGAAISALVQTESVRERERLRDKRQREGGTRERRRVTEREHIYMYMYIIRRLLMRKVKKLRN